MRRQYAEWPVVNISTMGPENGWLNASIGLTDRAWQAANRAIYVPVYIAQPIIITRVWWYNGNAVSGNVDVGIYDRGGRRIVSSGSTAAATVSVTQEVAVTATRIGDGAYWLALAVDNTTQKFIAGSMNFNRTNGVQQQATAFPLPATMTPAAATGVDYPIFGIGTRGFL